MMLFFLVLVLLTAALAQQQHCYMPDGSIADDIAPCNSTIALSACCDPRDSCTESGFCLGASGWIYRSGCTDQSWSSSVCPSQCRTDPGTNLVYSSYAPIYPCEAGIMSTNFCCGSYKSNFNCCSESWQLPNTGLAFKPGTDALLANLASLSAIASLVSATSSSKPSLSSTSSTPSSTSSTLSSTSSTLSSTSSTLASTSSSSTLVSSGSSSNLGLAIGAGVGVPFGFLGLGLLVFLFWREKRRSTPSNMAPAPIENISQQLNHERERWLLPNRGRKSNFSPVEADSGEPRHMMAGTDARAF